MAMDWMVSKAPDPAHVAWADSSKALFASPSWVGVVETLGAECFYLWNPKLGIGGVLAVFRQWGIRVGYLGFPVASSPSPGIDDARDRAFQSSLAASVPIDVLRVNGGQASDFDATATAAKPEVWIADMDEWLTSGRKKRRKDLAYAERMNPGLSVSRRPFDGNAAFEFYAATVRAHRGNLRYVPQYFRKLAELSSTDGRLRSWSAFDRDGEFRGFAVSAIHGDTAYYLHGAVDAVSGRNGVSDLLLDRLIDDARASGCRRFSLMASPWSQPGLVRFKQKWGERRGLAHTTDIGLSATGRVAHAYLRWQARDDRAEALRWASRVDVDHPDGPIDRERSAVANASDANSRRNT